MLPDINFNCNVLDAILPGVIKDAAAFTAQVIDLADEKVRGAKTLRFLPVFGTIDADMAAFKVMESDTKTDATTLGGTPTEVLDVLDTVTPGDDEDNAKYFVDVDLSAPRKRYLQLQATAGDGAAGTYLTVVAFAICPNAIADYNGADLVIAA